MWTTFLSAEIYATSQVRDKRERRAELMNSTTTRTREHDRVQPARARRHHVCMYVCMYIVPYVPSLMCRDARYGTTYIHTYIHTSPGSPERLALSLEHVDHDDLVDVDAS